MNNEKSDTAKVGVKQVCIPSPLFVIVIDEGVKDAKRRMREVNLGYYRMQGIKVSELLYSDDMAMVPESEEV